MCKLSHRFILCCLVASANFICRIGHVSRGKLGQTRSPLKGSNCFLQSYSYAHRSEGGEDIGFLPGIKQIRNDMTISDERRAFGESATERQCMNQQLSSACLQKGASSNSMGASRALQ